MRLTEQLENHLISLEIAADARSTREEFRRLDEEIERLRDIIRRRLNCDGSNGRYHAAELYDLTREMRAAVAQST